MDIGTFSATEIDEFIELAKNEIDPKDFSLSIHISYTYCIRDQFENAKLYLNDNVDMSKPSEELLLYCKVLFKTFGSKQHLLTLLKKWREHFSANLELLQIEFEMVSSQKEWTEAIKIAKFAIEAFPNSEYFVENLFVAMAKGLDWSGVENNYKIVKDHVFDEQRMVINIASVLLQARLFQESLDFLF